MSKSSTVTAGPAIGSEVRVSTGNFLVRAETLIVESAERVELIDLTEGIARIVRDSSIQEGLVSIWSLHTTCAVFINEQQAALHVDIKQFLEQAVARDGKWMHNDPEHS